MLLRCITQLKSLFIFFFVEQTFADGIFKLAIIAILTNCHFCIFAKQQKQKKFKISKADKRKNNFSVLCQVFWQSLQFIFINLWLKLFMFLINKTILTNWLLLSMTFSNIVILNI